MKELLIGVAGGTGSGKTTVVRMIVEDLAPAQVLVIPQDAYYHDQSHLSPDARTRINYDHPSAYDTELLVQHLRQLNEGFPIRMPIYNFATHCREKETIFMEPREVVILEGILVLWEEAVRKLLDMKVYVETDADERFIRRLQRDIAERGRTVESVIIQYQTVVRPMHLQFVEPSKRYADVIVPFETENPVAIDLISSKIRTILAVVT